MMGTGVFCCQACADPPHDGVGGPVGVLADVLFELLCIWMPPKGLRAPDD